MKKSFFQISFFDLVIIFVIALYVAAATSVSLNRYWQFNAFWYELGLYDTAIYKVAHFNAPIIEFFNNRWIFADHFNPSLFLFSPIYWIFKGTEFLLVAQAIAVGLSAWFAYLIGKRLIADKLILFALMLAYLMFVGLQNALFTDFHDTTVATLFVILTFWAIFNKRWVLYWIFLLITLGFKENMAGFGIGIGFFLILSSRQLRNIKIAILTILLSVVYFFLVTRMVIPFFSGGTFSYNPTFASTSAKDIIMSYFVPLNLKARTLLLTFSTFGFAPLFAPSIWPLLFEHYTERFVMTQAATRWDLGFHYNAILSPILFVGSLPVITWLSVKNLNFARIWSIFVIFTVIFFHRFYLHGPLLLAHHPVFYRDTKNAQFMRDFVANIPTNYGLVMTGNNIAPHLSHKRVTLIDLQNFDNISPSVVALDLRDGQNANNFFPATQQDAKALYTKLGSNSNYELIGYNDYQFIFVKINNH